MWTTWTFWVDLGTAVGGIATAVLALFAITGGSAGLKDWREKVRADSRRADEETYNLRYDSDRPSWASPTSSGSPPAGGALSCRYCAQACGMRSPS
jgi:hypothetical protein